MKLKILTLLGLLSVSPAVLAADSAEVGLVKRIYREAAAKPDGSMEILKRYADSSLKQAIRTIDRVGNQGESCLDADPVWNSQDPEITRKVAVRELGGGRVRASFKQYGSNVNVDFVVNCSGGTCRISDANGIKALARQCR